MVNKPRAEWLYTISTEELNYKVELALLKCNYKIDSRDKILSDNVYIYSNVFQIKIILCILEIESNVADCSKKKKSNVAESWRQ